MGFHVSLGECRCVGSGSSGASDFGSLGIQGFSLGAALYESYLVNLLSKDHPSIMGSPTTPPLY